MSAQASGKAKGAATLRLPLSGCGHPLLEGHLFHGGSCMGRRAPEAGALGFGAAWQRLPRGAAPPTSPEASQGLGEVCGPQRKEGQTAPFPLSQTLLSPSAGRKRTSPTCTTTPPSCWQPKVRAAPRPVLARRSAQFPALQGHLSGRPATSPCRCPVDRDSAPGVRGVL